MGFAAKKLSENTPWAGPRHSRESGNPVGGVRDGTQSFQTASKEIYSTFRATYWATDKKILQEHPKGLKT